MPRQFRNFDGNTYELSGIIHSEKDAEFDASQWRARGGLARIIPLKKGYALYLNSK